MDTGIAYMQHVLDLDAELALAPARADYRRAVDPELRRDQEIADRAEELEVELTVEGLCERLDAFGLAACRDRLDQILCDLAEKELEAKADWS